MLTSKEENTTARLPLSDVQVSRRASLYLEKKVSVRRYCYFIFTIQTSVLASAAHTLHKQGRFVGPQRFVLHIEEDTGFFHLLFNQGMAPKFLCLCTTWVYGGGATCICGSLSMSSPADTWKGSRIHGPIGFQVCLHCLNKKKKRLEAIPYVSIIQEVILGNNKKE